MVMQKRKNPQKPDNVGDRVGVDYDNLGTSSLTIEAQDEQADSVTLSVHKILSWKSDKRNACACYSTVGLSIGNET